MRRINRFEDEFRLGDIVLCSNLYYVGQVSSCCRRSGGHRKNHRNDFADRHHGRFGKFFFQFACKWKLHADS